MEVTRANFQEVLEELETVLKDATFLAIDGEFTGLNSGPEAKRFDTPAQYYTKLRCGSMDFLMVQFGLSVFTHNAQTDKYSQRSYNFYVFPKPLNSTAPDCRFMCQASSITFLSERGFDFNKLFTSGIPYLNNIEEERLSKKFEEKQRVREEGLELIPISDTDKPQIEEICTRIDEFLASDAEELSIDRCNAFIRRLIHQEARMRWPNKLRLEAKTEGGSQNLLIYKKGTKEKEKQREAERREKEKEEMKNALGLTALLRKIADSGKPMVGHNMLLDLCHMIHQFFGPLPENYREFKSLIHDLFPRLLDTKLICGSPQLREKIPSSILDAVLETVSKKPFSIPEIEPVEGRSYSLSSEHFHEAGYDAYVTGLCFIALSNYLGTLENSENTTVLPDSPLLQEFQNKLLIMRLKDFPYIDLVESDPKPSRDHVFHITFPKEWKTSDISQLFTPFGGVYVAWLNDTSAYVDLYKREQASSLLKNLAKNKRMRSCKIQTYAAHQDSLNEESDNRLDRKRKSQNDTSKKERSTEKTGDNDSDSVAWEMASGIKYELTPKRELDEETSFYFKNGSWHGTTADTILELNANSGEQEWYTVPGFYLKIDIPKMFLRKKCTLVRLPSPLPPQRYSKLLETISKNRKKTKEEQTMNFIRMDEREKASTSGKTTNSSWRKDYENVRKRNFNGIAENVGSYENADLDRESVQGWIHWKICEYFGLDIHNCFIRFISLCFVVFLSFLTIVAFRTFEIYTSQSRQK